MTKQQTNERRSRARRRALQALYQWQMTGQDASEIISQFRKQQDLSLVDEEYFERLLNGVAGQRDELDEGLGEFVDRPVAQLDMMELAIIRLSGWELLNAPEVPFRVVLDEGIDLAHRFGAEQGHAFVNGVLDKAAKAWRPMETG
jgi:transcription antitermination protein NusB